MVDRVAESDLCIIGKQETHTTDALFEIEPTNLYRDSVDDAGHAAKLLSRLEIPDRLLGHRRASIYALLARAETALARFTSISPIDDAWESRRVLYRRMEIQRVALKGIERGQRIDC